MASEELIGTEDAASEAVTASTEVEKKARRTMSPEGRARVAEAQRLRWAKRREDIAAGITPKAKSKGKKAKVAKDKARVWGDHPAQDRGTHAQVLLVSKDGQATMADLATALEDLKKAREAFTRLVNQYVNG